MDYAVFRHATETFAFLATNQVATNSNNPDYTAQSWEEVKDITFPTSRGEITLTVARIPQSETDPRVETTRIAGIDDCTYEFVRGSNGEFEVFRLGSENEIPIPHKLSPETKMAINAALAEGLATLPHSA